MFKLIKIRSWSETCPDCGEEYDVELLENTAAGETFEHVDGHACSEHYDQESGEFYGVFSHPRNKKKINR